MANKITALSSSCYGANEVHIYTAILCMCVCVCMGFSMYEAAGAKVHTYMYIYAVIRLTSYAH